MLISILFYSHAQGEKQRNGCWFSVPARLRKYWWINCCSVAFHKAPAVTSCSQMQNDKCIYKFEKFNFIYSLWLLAFCILKTQTIHVFFIDTGTVFILFTFKTIAPLPNWWGHWFLFFFFVYQADNLTEALKKLKITSTDSTADSLEGCLDCLLQALAQNSKLYGPFKF